MQKNVDAPNIAVLKNASIFRYEQVKNKRYVPAFKTKEAANKEIQKQLDRLHQLSNILEKVNLSYDVLGNVFITMPS